MARFPKSVDVLGKPYAIALVTKESLEGDYGECKHDECRIDVATFQCDHQKRDTILHEVMHAVDHELHCKLSEPQVRRMATGLLAVLRHNPALVAFLVDA